MEATTQEAMPAALSPAEQLRERFWDLKKSRVRVSAAHTSRASSIGHECERFLFYERTAGELRQPHPPELQAIFDLGNNLERYIVRELEAMGCDIVQRERDYHDRDRELTGHADAKIRMTGWPRPLPLEIKGLNPYSADKIETIGDIRDCPQKWIRKYYSQLQLYIHFDDAPAGVFALMNKTSGQIQFIDCPRDQPHIDALLAKAERIRDAVKANEPLPRSESDECGKCAFAHVCMPNRAMGPGVRFFDDAEAMALIARRQELAPAKSEIESIDKRLKTMLPEAEEVMVGDYLVKAKHVEKKAFQMKATSYWQRTYVATPRSAAQ
jgi:hypothetical protein